MADPNRTTAWPWIAIALGALALVVAIVLITRPASLAPREGDDPGTRVSESLETDQGVPANQPANRTPTAGPENRPVATPPSGESVSATVNVDMGEWFVRVDNSTIPGPGRVAFRVRNVGDVTHGFAIEGQGVEKRSETIGPDGETWVTLDLAPGNYVIYCYVGNHRERGMESPFEVRRPS